MNFINYFQKLRWKNPQRSKQVIVETFIIDFRQTPIGGLQFGDTLSATKLIVSVSSTAIT